MSTIQQLIEGYAEIYLEPITPHVNIPNDFTPRVHRNLLSEKDFLADIARGIAIDGCDPEMVCAFREMERYRTSPDGFIDEYVGAPASTLRHLHEQRAKEMMRVAQKYRLSQDEDKPEHPFHQEMKDIEIKYARCLLTRGIVEFLSKAPAKPSELNAMVGKIEVCLSREEKPRSGRLPSDNVVRP